MDVFWFLPTHGDGHYLGTTQGARPVTLNYLKQVAQAADSLEDVSIRGVTANIGQMDVEEPASGRYISDGDNEHRATTAFIGSETANRLFPNRFFSRPESVEIIRLNLK